MTMQDHLKIYTIVIFLIFSSYILLKTEIENEIKTYINFYPLPYYYLPGSQRLCLNMTEII